VFKDPTSSILQIGGFDQGLTDSLLSTLKAGACGQALTSNILILDTLEENVSQIQERYDSESSTVSALQYDMAKSLSSQMSRGDNFDVLLVTMDPQLDGERRRAFLTEARKLLNSGGIFVVFDTLPNIRDK
jgi:glutathione synthase/RimK-type ligase-like ATP-grasp enzyme